MLHNCSGIYEETEKCDLGCKYAEWGQWERFARYENELKQTFLPDGTVDPVTGNPTGNGVRTQFNPIHTYSCIRPGSMN